VFLDFYVTALFNLRFTICGSYIDQVWPPLVYATKIYGLVRNVVLTKKVWERTPKNNHFKTASNSF